MTQRARDILLLVAGLTGVAAFFLPVQEFFGPITPLGFLWDELANRQTFASGLTEFYGAEWVTVLPFLVAAVQVWRLRGGAECAGWWLVLPLGLALALQVAHVAVLAQHLAAFDGEQAYVIGDPPALVPLVLSLANLGLLYVNLRRRRGLPATVEMLLLGTYVAIGSFWILWLLGPGWKVAFTYVGFDLMVVACVVYAVTIIIRLRQESLIRAGQAIAIDRPERS